MENKYRFLEKDHLHQLWSDRKEEYENLTGTTTILEVLGKPLAYWASGLAVKEFSGIDDCRILTKIKNKKATTEEVKDINTKVGVWLETHKDISVEDYIKICQKAYSAHAETLKDTAEEGTDLHTELEKIVKIFMAGGAIPAIVPAEKKQLLDFMLWAKENVKRFIGSEVHCYDEIMFVGGICDVVAEMKDGSYAIIDFKRAKDAYFSHFCQCAGYDLQLQKNGGLDKDGNTIMALEKPISRYIIIPFGKPEFGPVENNNIKGLQKAFVSLVNIYREKSIFENK